MMRAARIIIVLIALNISIALLIPQFQANAFRPDYAVFWTAARMALTDAGHLYDPVAMTEAQRWISDPANGPRPWAYPPTALPLFTPFAMLPFLPSFILWASVSLAAFIVAARWFVGAAGLLVTVITPPVVQAIFTGQVVLLVAAATMTAMGNLDRRPRMAGALLGVAAAVKPHVLLLFPLALVRGATGRHLSGPCLLVLRWSLFRCCGDHSFGSTGSLRCRASMRSSATSTFMSAA